MGLIRASMAIPATPKGNSDQRPLGPVAHEIGPLPPMLKRWRI